jgi:spore germination protein YaaH
MEHFVDFYKTENTNQFLKILMRRLKYNRFNGIIFECNQVWLIDKYYANFSELARKISEELHKENMLFILPIFPYSETINNILSRQRFEYLSRYADYFNVMTYDYISHLGE